MPPIVNDAANQNDRLLLKNIPQYIVDKIVDESLLKELLGRSLIERAVIMVDRFKLEGFKPYHRRAIYKSHKIALKKIRYTKITKENKIQEQLEKIRACHAKVEKLKQLGHEPIYIDEVMFTSSTNMESTWLPKYSPIMLDRKKADTKPIACIAAISARNGIELVMQFDFSVDKKKFESFLIKLREKMG